MIKDKMLTRFGNCRLSSPRIKIADLLAVLLILLVVMGCGRVSTSRSNSRSRRNETTKSVSGNTAKPASTDDPQLANTLATVSLQYSKAGSLGDKATLRRVLADDFSAEIAGKTYDKEKFMENVESAGTLISEKINNPRIVEQEGAFATLEYEIVVEFKDRTASANCTDEFVNRAGKWQIKSNKCLNQ